MSDRTITLTLPDALYERARETAKTSHRSLEDVLTQSIAISLPPLENDLPPEIRSEFAALSLLSDAELLKIAKSTMAKAKQKRLERLADLQKQRQLKEAEQRELQQLFNEGKRVMLRKAEAFRLLGRRGYTVFSQSGELVI